MKNISVKLIAGLAAVTLFLSACGGNTGTTGSEEKTDGENSSTADVETEDTKKDDTATGEKVKITLMQSKVEIQESLQTVIDEYNGSQEEVEVELLGTTGDGYSQVLQSNFAADPASAPTIFSISGPATKEFEQFFSSLQDTESAGRISEGLKAEFTAENGDIVGLPSGVEGYGFVYNKSMFDEAGIDAASIKDVDGFVAAAEKLAAIEGVEAPIAFAQEEYFLFIHFFNWGVALTENYADEIEAVNSGEKKLADLDGVKQWAEALDKIKDLTNKGQNSYDEQVAGFGAGQFAMIHQGNWAQGVLMDNEVDFEYAFLPFPLNGNESLAVGTASAWRVNNGSADDQQAAAKKFLDWLILSEEGAKHSAETLGMIPAFTDVVAPEGGLSQSVAEYVSDNKTIEWAFNSVFPSGIEVDGARLMQSFYSEDITADELLEELNTVWVDLASK